MVITVSHVLFSSTRRLDLDVWYAVVCICFVKCEILCDRYILAGDGVYGYGMKYDQVTASQQNMIWPN